MRLPRALNPNENPAQFGIFFSANRPRSHRVFHRAIGNSDRLFRSIGCGSPRWVSNSDYSLRVEYGARGFCRAEKDSNDFPTARQEPRPPVGFVNIFRTTASFFVGSWILSLVAAYRAKPFVDIPFFEERGHSSPLPSRGYAYLNGRWVEDPW
uniref:Uncharacterized protein n=1 Tax=Candidatus Kentrum sp. FM TaxID=2126340 RepID=A0A450SMQ6_9GAMM|nr:MAG: hypothetical protein BECKFM1743A_GA0114220_101411 [Candidatus Kentron sp. FM]